MYAVIETGGKQYRVQKGDTVFIEKINGDEGEEVKFDKVLLVSDNGELKVGRPYVEGVDVLGKILEHGKSRKVIVFKYKAKKDYKRKQGHRQPFTKVQIAEING